MDSLAIAASLLCPAATLVTLGYAAVCTASPFGRCRRCRGLGRTVSRSGRRVLLCRHCDGAGIRIRTGRHLFHLAARIHRDGTH
ncbi:hypothetical protein [Mangrovihabitans endophyticus]|uniref:Uncharacterized protein n=1 Tax=Mangrovihabitans endophyticus TaxID=1751298 RepID=A0A8J3FR11_9ACTN|nr:hypothetical protein [Mangrovihabitans endophyticus]GGL05340.1 hypothetical protein GCM10012284_44780 [Mangrovihabitans endophyticus]